MSIWNDEIKQSTYNCRLKSIRNIRTVNVLLVLITISGRSESVKDIRRLPLYLQYTYAFVKHINMKQQTHSSMNSKTKYRWIPWIKKIPFICQVVISFICSLSLKFRAFCRRFQKPFLFESVFNKGTQESFRSIKINFWKNPSIINRDTEFSFQKIKNTLKQKQNYIKIQNYTETIYPLVKTHYTC